MPTSDWAATVRSVGTILRARTVDANGNELGTFTADTRPTAEQVQELLDEAVGRLASEVGSDIDAKFWAQARSVAALDAALTVELTYWPEQVATGRSPYEQLKELHTERRAALVKAVSEEGDDTDEEVGGAGSPSYGFPADAGGLVGWGTKF